MNGAVARCAGIALRGLFVQSSWSFQRMQSPGWFLLRAPDLARRHRPGSPEWTREALEELKTFNTHPYFAGLVAGTVAREEEGGEEGRALAAGLRRSLMCALGGVGDEFFWAHLRPAAALAALVAANAGAPGAAVVLLAVYNVPHLALRAWGPAAGYARGRGVVSLLQARPFGRSVPALAGALAALAGALVGLAASRETWPVLPGGGPVSAAAFVGAFLGFLLLLARGVGFQALLAGMTAAALLAGAARVAVAP